MNDYRIKIIYCGDDKSEGNTRKEKIKGEAFDDGFMLFSHWVCLFCGNFSF